VLVEQPGPALAYVHGLEDPVTTQRPEIIGAQDRGVEGHDTVP
jgi:hypothetical protein